MSKPLVTVIIPCYNQERYLAEAIQSVIDQDYRPLQIIVSDDASIDDTPQLAKQYKERYPDLIDLQLHHENIGVSRNCESIFPLIKGEYICWFAGDDLFLPGKISAQVGVFERSPEIVLCYHDVQVFNDKGVLYNYNDASIAQKPSSGYVVPQLLRYKCFVATPSMMIKRSKTESVRHRGNIGVCSDWLYVLEIAMCGPIAYIDKPFVKYRRHGKNLSNLSLARAEMEVYDFMFSNYPRYARDINKGRGRLSMIQMIKNLISARYSEAGKWASALWLLLKKDPFLLIDMISALFCQADKKRRRLYHRACLLNKRFSVGKENKVLVFFLSTLLWA